MRELTFNFGNPQIKINGVVFDLQKSDIEICEMVKAAQRRLQSMDKANSDAVLSACKATAEDIDAILGHGALATLSGGRPVGIMQQIELLIQIASAGTQSYMDYVKAEYLPEKENG